MSKKIMKIILKFLPYIISIVVGVIFYSLSKSLQENIGELFVNISTAFFAIPLIFLFYQLISNLSRKELNKEMFDYVKMKIDRELISITNNMQKILYFPKGGVSEREFNDLVSLEKKELKKIISEKEYLGFQLFKKWDGTENNLHDILKDNYTFKILEDEQIISVILIIKALRHLESVQKINDLFLRENRENKFYKIESGVDVDAKNTWFPEKHLLLLEPIKNRQGLFSIKDFGYFYNYDIEKLLGYFSMNNEYVDVYTNAIFSLIEGIKNWLQLTGKEFVVDTKMFKLRRNKELKTVE